MKQTSTSNYAKALVDLAQKDNKLDLIVYQFEILMDVVKSVPKFLDFLTINPYTVKNHLDLLEGFDPLFIHFLEVLSKNKVLRQLKYIYMEVRALANKLEQQAYVRIYSAKHLSDSQRQSLLEQLHKMIPGKEIILNEKVDKSVLAGVKIIYQGKNLDLTMIKYLDDLFNSIGR